MVTSEASCTSAWPAPHAPRRAFLGVTVSKLAIVKARGRRISFAVPLGFGRAEFISDLSQPAVAAATTGYFMPAGTRRVALLHFRGSCRQRRRRSAPRPTNELDREEEWCRSSGAHNLGQLGPQVWPARRSGPPRRALSRLMYGLPARPTAEAGLIVPGCDRNSFGRPPERATGVAHPDVG